MELSSDSEFRSGYVVLAGRPNAGKSTLLNHLLGEKVAIVSRKPQTTRNRILGVLTDEQTQFIFLDTPGLHKPSGSLNQFMVKEAMGCLADADVAVLMFDGTKKLGAGDRFLVQQVHDLELSYLAVLNKIDCLTPPQLQTTWDELIRMTPDACEHLAISALKKSGTEDLLNTLRGQLPPGPLYYPADTLTDCNEVFMVGELIREQVFEQTHDELPYASAIRIQQIKQQEGRPTVVKALILVEHDSQKAIMIGRGGQRLKSIGSRARSSLEEYLEQQVFLELKVEVRKNWRRKPRELGILGYASTDEVEHI